MDFINTVIGIPLGYIMWLCYTIVKNYGIAILLFTLLTKALMFPLNIWVQKNSIKMVKLQPRLNEIAAACVGKRDMIAEKQLALYKQENYKPLAGTIPLLIQIPIILGLIAVVYNPLQHLLHIDANIINAFTQKTMSLLGTSELGSGANLKIIEMVNDPAYAKAFSDINVPGVADAIAKIKALDLNFLGINLAAMPSLLSFDILLLIPLLSGGSSFLLSVVQNKINVLQKEAGWLGRWGMAIFLTLFSLYFAFIVPTGVGLYWIFSNAMSMLIMVLVNLIYPPKKYIDYEALEKSKVALAQSKELEKKLKPTSEQKARAKADYQRFFADDNKKQIVFYSEKSGFYKYYKGVIEYINNNSDIIIDYVTSDPNDQIFKLNNPKIRPYYIDDNKLIILFMKVDAEMFVMTTPDLQQFHLKRSYVTKNIEYIYMYHGMTNSLMVGRKNCIAHYDTVFCVGLHQIAEFREEETLYNLKPRNLLKVGYPYIDELIAAYDAKDHSTHERPQILIAPSWQDDNIMDSCIDKLIDAVKDKPFDIIVRPHPEYVKHYEGKLTAFNIKYCDYKNIRLESDFSSNNSIFESDILITDWSTIAYDFAYSTKKPCVFINTPMKVMNPEYIKFTCENLDIKLRSEVGVSVEIDEIGKISDIIAEMLLKKDDYREKITDIVEKYVFNQGKSAAVGGEYIIKKIKSSEKK